MNRRSMMKSNRSMSCANMASAADSRQKFRTARAGSSRNLATKQRDDSSLDGMTTKMQMQAAPQPRERARRPSLQTASKSLSLSAHISQSAPEEAPANKPPPEIEHLTNMLKSLAQQLKHRDAKILELEEQVRQVEDNSQKLEAAEDKLLEAQMENHTLQKRVETLEAEQAKAKQQAKATPEIDAKVNKRWNQEGQGSAEANGSQSNAALNDSSDWTIGSGSGSGASPKPPKSPSPKKVIDQSVLEELKIERDAVIAKAGSLSIRLAESQATVDELRDQIEMQTAEPQPEQDPNPAGIKSIVNLWSSGYGSMAISG